MLTGRLRRGDGVERFERGVATKLGSAHAVAMPQARMGIHLTLKTILEPGQRVVMSPYTIADVVNMVICAGGVPVFCDVEPNTCNIDPEKIEPLIDENTGAVLITHLHGLAAHPKRCREICDRHNVPLIEDSAQAFGATVDGRRTGTFGRAGIISIGMYKNVNAWYGGAVLTDDEALAASLREELRSFEYESARKILKRMRKGILTDALTWPPIFKTLTFWIFRYGAIHDVEAINKRVRTELDVSRYDEINPAYLRKLTPTQASLALSQIDRIDRDTDARIARARMYYEGLKDLEGPILPPPVFDGSHIYTYYPIRCPDRDEILKWLMKHNCDIAAQHLKNCADLPGFDVFEGDCPIARDTAAQIVLLPTYPRYSERDIQRNIDALRAYPGWSTT
jgi:dTDP-4-amino-4,6-dideoxygalactose transaminase